VYVAAPESYAEPMHVNVSGSTTDPIHLHVISKEAMEERKSKGIIWRGKNIY